MKRKLSIEPGLALAALVLLLSVLPVAVGQSSVAVDRASKAKKQDEPKGRRPNSETRMQDFSIDADPALLVGGDTSASSSQPRTNMAYYIRLLGVSKVMVSDAHGHSDRLFQRLPAPAVRSAVYDYLGPDSVSIVLPVDEAYTVEFQTVAPAMAVEIARGRDNVSPEELIRYRDLNLPPASSSRLLINRQGLELRLDKDGDGRFESLIEPTGRVQGLAARDHRGPLFKFRVVERSGPTVLLAIEAVDEETGVKSLHYSLDGHQLFPYQAPIRINLQQTSFVYAFAEDNAGNRSGEKYRLDSGGR